jgi:putative ABC transport system permease protein
MKLLEQAYRDLRYAARTLARSPGVTLAAIVTLALGIGANTAIFNTIDDALLRPLPLPAPDRLADIYTYNKALHTYVSSSYPDYEDFARRTQTFQQISAYVRIPFRVTIGEATEQAPVEAVTANYFSMLGLPAWRGRGFEAEDGGAGAAPVAMIAEDFWRNHFHGDPAAIGKTILIEDQAFTITGVVPRRYRGTNLNWGLPPQIWIPLRQTERLVPTFHALGLFHRRVPWLVLIGRLRAGVTVTEAQAELQAIAGAVAQAEPATNRNLTAVVYEASHSKFWPGYRTSVTASLAVFAIAAGLVLLLACANVSNLLLERALGRRREFAIRLAIGAGRGRLLGQLLAESGLLVLPGIALALAVASGLEKVMLHFPNALGLPLALDVTVASRALWFCLGLALASSLLFGLAPAIQATRPEILPSLKESGNALAGGGRDWYRRGLVVVQVAFSMILLAGGGLFGRSLLKAYSVDLGFRGGNLLTAEFTEPQMGTPEVAQFPRLQQALVQRVAGLPGVQSASLASEDVLSPVRVHANLQTPGAASEPVVADRDFVSPDFFAGVGIPLLRGRAFNERDDAQARRVAIVNQTLAGRLWPGADPVGQTMLLAYGGGKAAPVEVVGVARDARYHSVWEEAQAFFYLPMAQSQYPANYLVVRTRLRPQDVIPAIRREWQRLAPRRPFDEFHTGQELVDFSLGPQRMAAAILAAFAGLALILATVGLYSVMAYAVRQRTREIGIRMAVGARPETVVRQLLGESMRMVAAGVLLGTAAGAGLMRFVTSQIKDVSPYDAWTFGAVACVLVSVGLAAALVPARRAARTDPLTALRCD